MARISGLAVAVVAVFLMAMPLAAQAADTRTGRLLVTLKAQGIADAVAVRHGAKVALPPVNEIRLAVFEPAKGQGLGALAKQLRADRAVQSVRAELQLKPSYVPTDPAFSLPLAGGLPGTVEEWWAGGSQLFKGWDVAKGSGATVAIIDTGIDAAHPEFAGKIKRKIDYDRDPAHKGASFDEVGHGTHVASLACAAPDNGQGIAGAGFGCKLLIAKTDLTEGSVASSIIWAVKHRADAINMSFGTDTGAKPSPEIKRAMRYAYNRDAVMIAAAADEPRTEQGDPANLLQPTGTGRHLNSSRNRGLTVTAATAENKRASFAGRGSQISLAAYGSYGSAIGSPGLLGAFPSYTTDIERGSFRPPVSPCGCRTTINGDNRYAHIQGTSMAAPLVAGVVAMVRQLNPDLDNRAVIKLIKRTAKRSGGWNSDVGWGILDSDKAIRAARNADARAPRSKIRTAKGLDVIKLTWSGADKGPRDVRVTGIVKYEIYRVSPDGTTSRVKTTKRESASVLGTVGDGFYSVAVDGAGNKEKAPSKPDVTLD